MAKKDKKEKKQKKGKEKPEKKRKKNEEEEENPNIPYPGSDKTKVRLARLLVVLSAIALGLMIYTVHYIKYINVKKQEAVDAAIAAEARRVVEASREGGWYSRPDGTFAPMNGTPALPQASGEPALPGAVGEGTPGAGDEESPEQQEGGEGEAAGQEGSEAETAEEGEAEAENT